MVSKPTSTARVYGIAAQEAKLLEYPLAHALAAPSVFMNYSGGILSESDNC